MGTDMGIMPGPPGPVGYPMRGIIPPCTGEGVGA